MRNFLLLCMAALCCLACNDSKIVTVTVTNPLAMDRSDEMVEVSMTEISNLLNLADTAQIVVLKHLQESNSHSRMQSLYWCYLYLWYRVRYS